MALVDERERDLAAAAKNNDLNAKSMLVLKRQLDDARAHEERLRRSCAELKAAAQNTTQTAPFRRQTGDVETAGSVHRGTERVDELQQIDGIGAVRTRPEQARHLSSSVSSRACRRKKWRGSKQTCRHSTAGSSATTGRDRPRR